MGFANRKMGRKEGSWFLVLGSSLVPRGIGAWFFVLRKYGMHRSVARQAAGGGGKFPFNQGGLAKNSLASALTIRVK